MNSRKSFSHEEKVSLAYLTYNSKMASAFFPDKESSANEVISALANIYGLNLDECTAQDYTDILKTYTDTLIRIAMGSPKEMIATSLQIKHGKLVKNQEIANRVLSYITLNNNTGESSGIRNGNASKPKETFKTVSAAPEKDVFEDEVIEKEKRDINSTPLLDRENNSPHA